MFARLLHDRARVSSGRVAVAVAVSVGVGVTMLCWILGNPRSSGPDEASHMVAASALVRGDRSGTPDPANPGFELFELPGMVGAPDPTCWVQPIPNLDVPVSCNNGALTTEERLAATTSANYPPWAFVLPGLASFAPTARGYAYLARVLNAAVPFALVAGALVVLLRRRPVAAAAALLGLTPIAWFTFGIVNPSAPAIAGGFALWASLLHHTDRRAGVLGVAGWTAVLIARRDGPVWALLIVLACCWLTGRRPTEVWRDLGDRARWIAAAVTVLPVLTPLADGERGFNLAIAFAPIGLVAVEMLIRWSDRLATAQARRALAGYSVGVVVLVAAIVTMMRPGGFRAETLRLVVANTGDHLRQLVGLLGWLNAPVPLPAVFLFWAVIGGLVTLASLEHRRAASVGVAVIGATIVTAWLLELGQGADDGQYWQGRYSMPFAVGLPLVLAWRADRRAGLADRIVPALAAAGWAIANLAFVAAQQRWAVGVNGSWYPWDWDTWSSPVPPMALVIVHLLATGVLALACVGPEPAATT